MHRTLARCDMKGHNWSTFAKTLVLLRKRDFSKQKEAPSFATPAGIDIVIREGSVYPNLRRNVAGSTEELGLSPEEFASLGWLGV